RSGLLLDQLASGAAEELIHEVGGVNATAEVRVLQNGLLKRNGRFHAGDHVFAEGAAHFVHGFAAIFAGRDEFGDQGVVCGRDRVTGVNMAVHAHATSAGLVIHFDSTGTGAEVIEGIFGVDAALDGMAFEGEVVLRKLERLAHRDENLLFDKVHAGDFFGDRVLDLNALVDFEEVKVTVVVHDEFDGAGVGVMRHFGNANSGFAHFFAQVFEFVFDEWGRRFFDNLLVAPLNRAVAFAQMDDIAAIVGEDLKLDVVGFFDEFLDVNAGVAERFFRFVAGGVVAFDQRDVVMSGAHPAPAAAGNRFDHHRITDPFGGRNRFLFVFHHPFGAGRRGDTCFLRQYAADRFVLKRIHGAGAGADEANVAVLADIGEVGVFRQKPVTTVNGIDVGDFRGADDAVDAQVAFVAGSFADANGFVRELHVHGIGVCVRF